MNVLAIGCHPDDIEINCAGTLAKCVKRGDNVTVCHVCNGNMGHVVIMPDELRKIRIEEAKKAGSLAGIKVVTADIGDLVVYHQKKEHRDILVDIIREANPDFIISHAPDDYMTDHVEVSKLVFNASFSASVPHYEPQLGEACPVTPIFYCDNSDYVNCEPYYFVDITDELETKLQMLACHESQLVWLRDHDHIDPAEKMIVTARFYGFQSGAEYAEAFRQCGVEGRMTTKRPLP